MTNNLVKMQLHLLPLSLNRDVFKKPFHITYKATDFCVHLVSQGWKTKTAEDV